MTATPQDVQAKLDSAFAYLQKTTSSYTQMVNKHGSDWTKWPATSKWFLAIEDIEAARAEAGQLTVKVLRANFTAKEV